MGADVARAGVNKRSWYNERFGADTVATFEPRLASAFAKAGIEGAYTLDGNTGDTTLTPRTGAARSSPSTTTRRRPNQRLPSLLLRPNSPGASL